MGGIGLGTFIRLPLPYLALAAVLLTALAVHARRSTLSPFHTGLIVAGIFIVIGLVRTEYAWSGTGQSQLLSQVGTSVALEGVVVREPDIRERSQHLYLRTGTEDIVLVITDRYESVTYGDRLSVVGTLATPEAFTTDLGRTFDYPGYLLARGVEYQVRYPDITILARSEGGVVRTALYILKQRFIAALGQVVPEPAAGLAAGLLLGVKQSLGELLELAFRQSGIIHIVVLSGYNLMIVAGFVMLVLSYIAGLRLRVVLGIGALLLFATMVGWSATVARATVMAVLALLALLLGRQYLVLRALVLAAVVMLAINPLLLVYDIGFQLSFLATLGLVLVAPQLETALLTGTWWQPVRQFLVATLAAQVAVTPLLLYHMGEVSLVALATNVLVLPAVPLAMLLSFLTGVAALLLPAAAPVFAYPTTAVLVYIIEQARFWAGVPYATLPVPAFSFLWVVLAYALLGYWWYRATRSRQAGEKVPPAQQVAEPHDLTGWTIVRGDTLPDDSTTTNTNAAPGEGAASARGEVPIFFRPDSSR